MEEIPVGIRFDVTDVDEVKKGADALKSLEDRAKKAADALAFKQMGAFGKQFEKVGFAAANAAQKQQSAFAGSWVKIGFAAEKAMKRHEAAVERAKIRQEKAFEHAVDKRVEKMQEASFTGGMKEGFGNVGKLTTASFYGAFLAEGAMKIAEGFVEGAKMAVETLTDGVKDAFKGAASEQLQRVGEFNILGGEDAKAFREDIERFAKLTPFMAPQLRGMMMGMRKAGVGQDASRQALATAMDLGGNNAGAVESLLGSFQGIYTRHGVSKRQLRGMLGETGTTVPDFYKALGKQLGITAKAAEKKADSGTMDPQAIMNAITATVNKRQGGAAGTGGQRVAETAEVRWAKLQEMPEEFFKKLADSPAFARANEALGSLLENLDPESPTGQRIMAAIEGMFDKIVGFMGDPKDLAENIAEKIGDAVDFAGELVEDIREWADALLPSLDTLEDMVMALRTMKAFTSNDTKAQAQVIIDQNKIDQRRLSRGVEKDLRERDPEMMQQAVQHRLTMAQMYQTASGMNGPINMPEVEKAARGDVEETKNKMRQAAGIHINAPVTIHAPGGDPEKVKQAASEGIQHGVSASEGAQAEAH